MNKSNKYCYYKAGKAWAGQLGEIFQAHIYLEKDKKILAVFDGEDDARLAVKLLNNLYKKLT